MTSIPQPTAMAPGCHGVIDHSLHRRECLHRLFEASADTYADNVAIAYGDDHVTYRELESRANQLARYLASRGIGRGQRVGILLDRSIELYVSILAALKSGATYVPLDPSYPADRVRYILADCDVKAVLTTSDLVSRYPFSCPVVALDTESCRILPCRTARLEAGETHVDDTDVCYIIYTSGSTGRPKGVQIEHGSICHWVRAAQTIYQITPADRIYQGFSIAFDASLEEIWMAWANGATLVPATKAIAQAGPELPARLAAAGVTVLSCVPTLLSMFEEDIPSLRLLILGGEACPQALVERWARPGRRMFNTYGPTEATVTATCAECRAGQPVTIGRPLPNYSVYILDSDLQPAPAGRPGKIYIGGIGLAGGYVNRDDLTRERFVPNPFAEQNGSTPRLYRTGDLAQFTEAGDIQFLGRTDNQVKIRGYRVELSEIEAQLLAAPGVRAAAVAVHELTPGIASPVAYVVPAEGTGELDWREIEGLLRERLPPYMLPASCEQVDQLPTLPSGKVDRTRLPVPQLRHRAGSAAGEAHVAPRTALERTIADVWASVFKVEPVSATADFFHDLGGQSLYAALAASKLRALPQLARVSVSDIYRYPTVVTLARAIEERRPRGERQSTDGAGRTVHPVSRWRHRVGGLVQVAGLYGLALLAFYPLLVLALLAQGRTLSLGTLVAAAVAAIAYCPLTVVVSILVKWAVIGRYRPGRYPLWGSYYLRWWLVQHVQALVPLPWLAGTPLMPLYCRLMGARVGANCYINTMYMQAFDLLTIGDNTSINLDAHLLGYAVEDGMLIIGPIHIGRDCFVGTHSVIAPGATLADGAQLGEHSMLSPGETIPRGAYWVGSPARRQESSPSHAEDFGCPALVTPVRRTAFALAHVLGMVLLPLPSLVASLPGAALVVVLYGRIGYGALLAAPLAAVLFVGCFCLVTALLKWRVLGKVSAGRYAVYSGFYLRKWFVDRLLLTNFLWMNSLFSTLYALPYLRLLGARMGENVEVERVAHITPDILTLCTESFIADAVYLGAPRVYRGQMVVGETRVGRRTFVGNSALLPAGRAVADHCLVAIQSVPPPHTAAGTSWLGSPALAMPRREINRAFPQTQTYRPTRRLRAARYAFDLVRVTLPPAFLTAMTGAVFFVTRNLAAHLPAALVVAVFPAVMLGAQVLTALLAVLVKWVAIGRYRPALQPLWSTFVWRLEWVTGLYESPAVHILVAMLTGTPFIAWIWRLFGVQVGRRVFADTTHVSEFDLVRIDDEAALNLNCGAQTHLFEDRVMKLGPIHIGPGCSIGSNSIVLYDTAMGAGSRLGRLSLLMKGESLPARTAWAGIPAQSDV